MSHLHIVTISPPLFGLQASFLRQVCAPVDPDIHAPLMREIVSEMFRLMYERGGVGLAAPQAGLNMRMVVIDASPRDPKSTPMVLINPVIEAASPEKEPGREGCLSIPGYVSFKVPRARAVSLTALNQRLQPVQIDAQDFLARVIQHEVDHLDGILFIDRLERPEDLEKEDPDARSRRVVEALFL